MPWAEAHTQRLVGRWESVAWMESNAPPIGDSWAISRWYTRPLRPRRRRVDERQLSLPFFTSPWLNYFFCDLYDRTGDMLTRDLIAAQQRAFESCAVDAARYWMADTAADAALRATIRPTRQIQPNAPGAPGTTGTGVGLAWQIPTPRPHRRGRGRDDRLRICTRPPCGSVRPNGTQEQRVWTEREWTMHIETIHHECSLCGRPFAECRCQEAQGQSVIGG